MSDSQATPQSVTLLLSRLKEGSNEAATALWDRYFRKLIELARSSLKNSPRRIADEEDIAVDVFHSLCDGAEQGRFDQLSDRDDLWKLLVVLTRHKSGNQLRHQTAKKRGGKQVRGHSAVGEAGFDYFFGQEPTPELLYEMQEEQERLLGMLADETLQQVALLRLMGHSIEETAQQLSISPRSVKRKMALIRDSWLVSLEPPLDDFE